MTVSKVTYAQSSDIKSRTFREYRRDMKKKAIAELEFLPFLEKLLAPATARKHGADADLWFLQQTSRLTRDPDYKAVWSESKQMLYEFQYAESIENLKYCDFKLSKVGRKSRGVRTAHTDRKFFYVVKPQAKYAFIKPSWIMEKGNEGTVSAWGNRPAFRVPVAKINRLLKDGGEDIKEVISAVDDKNHLLAFQDTFLDIDAEGFSAELQNAFDKKTLIKIMPTTLNGFFRVCFLLEKMREKPQNPGVWLVYLVSLYKSGLPAVEFARWMFALDFLYFNTEGLSENEQSVVSKVLIDARKEIHSRAKEDGSFAHSPQMPPAEETRQFLFAANLLEDIQQDFAVNYGGINKVCRIYEILPDFAKTADFVRGC